MAVDNRNQMPVPQSTCISKCVEGTVDSSLFLNALNVDQCRRDDIGADELMSA